MRKKIAIFVILVISMFGVAAVANAAIMASDYISVYYGDVYDNGNGSLGIYYSITGHGVMDQIGAKTVILQERKPSTTQWTAVATYTSAQYSDMLAKNADRYNHTLYYSGADSSCDYRAKIYFYSEKGGYDTREYMTNII